MHSLIQFGRQRQQALHCFIADQCPAIRCALSECQKSLQLCTPVAYVGLQWCHTDLQLFPRSGVVPNLSTSDTIAVPAGCVD